MDSHGQVRKVAVSVDEYDRLKRMEHECEEMEINIEKEYDNLGHIQRQCQELKRKIELKLLLKHQRKSYIAAEIAANEELKKENEKLKKKAQGCHCNHTLLAEGEGDHKLTISTTHELDIACAPT